MKVTLIAMLIVISCQGVDAKGWKGIVPLHSDRVDVERLLGAPTGECKCIYNTGSETVRVEYSMCFLSLGHKLLIVLASRTGVEPVSPP